MSAQAAGEAGLDILGEAGPGGPPPRASYANVAYGNTQPDAMKARWLTVRPDGTAVAYAGKVEYGQGIRTGLAIEVAEELRLPLESVEVILADTDVVDIRYDAENGNAAFLLKDAYAIHEKRWIAAELVHDQAAHQCALVIR